MPVSQQPGQRWSRSPVLRTGAVTGVCLSAVLTAWLIVANHVPRSAEYASKRNSVAAALVILLMLIPVGRFLRSPGRLFSAGLTGWAVLTSTYLLLGLYFERLYSRVTPFQVFILGGVAYGFFAVLSWVTTLMFAARHQPLVVTRRRTY